MLNKYFINEQKEFNDDDRTLVAWATTDDVDRDGESLSADGWDLKAFRKNSVLMACHDYHKFPVGKVVWIKPDPSDKPKGLKFKAQFAETDEGLDAWYLYRNGYMNAFSVGFNPLEDPIYDDKADGRKKPRRTYPKNELLEISCVPVPANAMALVDAGKSIKTKAFQEIIEDIITKPGWDESEGMFRYRVREPSLFRDGTFRTVTLTTDPKTVKSVMGKLKNPPEGDPMKIQNIMFPKSDWTLEQAKKWLADHPDVKKEFDDFDITVPSMTIKEFGQFVRQIIKETIEEQTEISASDIDAFNDDDDILVDALDAEGDIIVFDRQSEINEEILVGVGDDAEIGL